MRRAFYQLRTGKGGPVLLETPRNIWDADLDDVDYTPPTGNKVAPAAADVGPVADVLLQAKNPIIHAGQGCLYAEAWDELQKVAELLQAPVMTTMPGKSGFPEDHPLALGAASGATTGAAWHFLEKADLVFSIGSSLTRSSYAVDIPQGQDVGPLQRRPR